MPSRGEVLVYCCRGEDVAVLREVCSKIGSALRIEPSRVEVAHATVARRPSAIFIGAGDRSLKNLDVINVIQAIRQDLPIIVIAEDDSLELERIARQKGIFYYLVQPIERAEVEAVLQDALRHEKA